MLKLAVDSQMPLIAVTTRDTLHTPQVLAAITGKTPVKYSTLDNLKIDGDTLYFTVTKKGSDQKEPNWDSLYTAMSKVESTLIVVNPKHVSDAMFYGGELPVPRKLLIQYLMPVAASKEHAMSLIGALGGVTIKEAIELCRLTMARDASLTASGLMRTRKTFFHGHSGLTQVDAAQAFYDPPGPLVAYSKREKPFFLGETDNRLVPRGILLDGPPGTGKTAGAKYIAEQWGVPLYRVDIGGTKSKWLGESEAHMLNNLNRLDQEQPCVVLFDEMEKMFANQHDSGTTSAMMGQLLWWLAEHQSRVFTVMTTNARKKLPPEVYREGRIDEVFVFEGLEEGDAVGFVANVLATFKVKATAKIIDPIIKAVYAHETGRVSQAALTKASYVAVKALTKPVLPDDE